MLYSRKMCLKMSALKISLALLNTILALLGIGLIALSVLELNISTPGTSIHIAIVIQIFIGSFVILTSFLGCFGACRTSLGLTWTYAICVFILLVFQLYIIIVAHSTDYKQNAGDGFEKLWNSQTGNVNVMMHNKMIAKVEQQFTCCGKNSSKDYIALGTSIPPSCFPNVKVSSEVLNPIGCLEAIQKYAEHCGIVGMNIKWTLFGFEVLALIFTILLGISIRNKQRREQF